MSAELKPAMSMFATVTDWQKAMIDWQRARIAALEAKNAELQAVLNAASQRAIERSVENDELKRQNAELREVFSASEKQVTEYARVLNVAHDEYGLRVGHLYSRINELTAALQAAWMALIGYLPEHQNKITDAAIQQCGKVLQAGKEPTK